VRLRHDAGQADTGLGDPGYWKTVKTGDFIGLRDAEAFSEALAEGGSGGGADYRVGEIRRFALVGPGSPRRGPVPRKPLGSGPSPGEYCFLELGDEKGACLYLALVQAESGFETRLYFIPQGLLCGTRDELIDAGSSWLFLPPPDPEDFKSSELEYAPYPDVPEIEDDGRMRKLVFGPAGPALCLYAEADDTGAAVIIAEYAAETPTGEEAPANPLLLVLEEGWIRADGSQPEEGGYLSIMLGKRVGPGDLEHFPSEAGR